MHVDHMMNYLKAKGLSYVIPSLSGNGHLLETVIDKLKEGASAKALANLKSHDSDKRQKVADSMNMFF
ncbi:MAG: hypothetical protein HY801_06520, partial [Candidatus Lindowbacteria bacterium]|nr:hypothetical protein [Candidatus Lindowbacteria bacterium]